ncbi:cytochrome P450 [Streptomyces sp. Je 1-369]|uniref:cytochrome P450 n=1 Tax=Streptomyces sp. Je 1-369 TaxID=2966192 RepID=UPI002285625C|nr:cytochrome P450 [Streptomyces sp. Je 1-369]WAL93651.1 cytochrome P450 [Streptomyces sp. Je 1-369]
MNVAFELHDDFNAQDPRLALAESAKGCPYRWEPKKQTLYVFGAEEVRSILISDGFWSERSDDCRGSQLSKAEKERRAKLREFYGLWPIFSDGDRHKWARHVTIRLLRDTATPELFGTFERLAHELLSEAGEDAFDWTERIAQPLAHEAAAALTGRRDTGQLLDLTGAVMHELAAPDIDTTRIDRALEAVDSIRDWLGAHLQHPTSPVIAGLAKVWHGENAGPDCATALLTQLVTGSYEPTLTALCVAGELNTTSINAEFPVQNLREEVFRLATPFRFASRYARRPVSIGPHRLGTGDRVTVCLGTANLDPRLYPEPLEIAQRRGRPHSFSFGLGKHLCPGAPMARAVVDALLTAMMRLDVRFAVEKVEREPELPMLRYRQLKGRLRPAARKARPA